MRIEAALTPAPPPQPPVIAETTYAPTAITLAKGTVVSGNVDSLAVDDGAYLGVKSAKSGASQVWIGIPARSSLKRLAA